VAVELRPKPAMLREGDEFKSLTELLDKISNELSVYNYTSEDLHLLLRQQSVLQKRTSMKTSSTAK